MSNPGNLGFLRGAIFAQLQERGKPLKLPAEHPERPWLEWLGVQLASGSLPPLTQQPIDLNAAEFQAGGMLPEVVYSCLVQTWWHPQQSDWVARTRSEIYACYDPAELDRPGWTLTREALAQVNAYRLQELTPCELLEASRPFWGGSDCPERERMEGWLLLNLERFQRLQDVADCLFPFFHPGTAPAGPDPRQRLRIPAGLEWDDAVQILGQERVDRLLGN